MPPSDSIAMGPSRYKLTNYSVAGSQSRVMILLLSYRRRTDTSATDCAPNDLHHGWTPPVRPPVSLFVSRGLCSSSSSKGGRAAPIIQLPCNMVPPRLCCPPITDLSVPLHVGPIISPVEKSNLNSSAEWAGKANRE